MNLKRGVGNDHCYKKVRKQGGEHALASIGHWPIYLAKIKVSYHHSWAQHKSQ